VLETIPLDNVKSDGYAFQIEMTYLTFKYGVRVGEIPISIQGEGAWIFQDIQECCMGGLLADIQVPCFSTEYCHTSLIV
jgi:hypothetical protein